MDEIDILAIARLTGKRELDVEKALTDAEEEIHGRYYIPLKKVDKPTLEALRTEIKGGAKGWAHSMWLHSVASDYENDDVGADTLEKIRKKYKIKPC